MRTLVDSRRLAGRTARIGRVRSKAVRRRMTIPSLSSAAKSHAAAWATPTCSRTPIRICSTSLVRKTTIDLTLTGLLMQGLGASCEVVRGLKITNSLPTITQPAIDPGVCPRSANRSTHNHAHTAGEPSGELFAGYVQTYSVRHFKVRCTDTAVI